VNQRRKIMAFYLNYFNSKTVFEEEEILDRLPDAMRMDLMKQMNKELISPVPFFNGPPHSPNVLPDECIYGKQCKNGSREPLFFTLRVFLGLFR